jgi:hypothetical protein
MQTRTITVDYARPRGYDVGYRAENNFSELSLPVPAELEGADSYRVYFESTVGEYLQTELLTPTDGYVTVKITSDIVPEPGNMAAQLVAFRAGEIVGYAPMITGTAKVSIPDGTERLSHSLATEIALNTAARHSHANKAVLDKFAEADDGKPTYNGIAIGGGGGGTGGASTAEDVSYTNADLPNVSNVKGALDAIAETQQQHEDDITVLGDAFTELDKKAHTHDNKAVLDGITAEKTAEWDGKSDFSGSYNDLTDKPTIPTVPTALKNPYALTVNVDGVDTNYDGSMEKMVAVKGVTKQITTGSNITLADNTEYRLTNVSTLTLTYPVGDFESWMRLTFAESGNITVTLPADTKYIGTAPDFKNGETWELSFKDKVLAAQRVGEGT